jgi:hypothetical protein
MASGPLPSDRLGGLLDQADGAMARLAVGLVATHALRNVELTRLRLDGLDLARGRLTINRGTSRHTVYLDELTHGLAVAWLRERQRRWPCSSNPYLLVSQQTAVDPTHPPVTLPVIDRCFRPLGMSPSQLRADRILDEARHTADPVRLMRVFGLADTTAYPSAAAPPATGRAPRAPAASRQAGWRSRPPERTPAVTRAPICYGRRSHARAACAHTSATSRSRR